MVRTYAFNPSTQSTAGVLPSSSEHVQWLKQINANYNHLVASQSQSLNHSLSSQDIKQQIVSAGSGRSNQNNGDVRQNGYQQPILSRPRSNSANYHITGRNYANELEITNQRLDIAKRLYQPIPSIYSKPSGESKKYVPITTPRVHIPTPRIKTTNSPYRTVSRAGSRHLHRTASFHLHPIQVDYEAMAKATNGRMTASQIEDAIREHEKKHRAAYMNDLQRQAEEQKTQRSRMDVNHAMPASMNPNNNNIESSLRQKEREETDAYHRELAEQAEIQRVKRFHDEMAFGMTSKPFNQNQHLLNGAKPDNNMADFMRPSERPKNGLRGSPGWLGQTQPTKPISNFNNSISVGSPLISNNNINTLQRHNSAPLDYQQGATTTPYYSPIQAKPVATGPTPQDIVQKLAYDRQLANMQQQRAPSPEYNPFGKGGGGAPVRDRNGQIITDRRKLTQGWNRQLDSNVPHDYQFSMNNINGSRNAGVPLPMNNVGLNRSSPGPLGNPSSRLAIVNHIEGGGQLPGGYGQPMYATSPIQPVNGKASPYNTTLTSSLSQSQAANWRTPGTEREQYQAELRRQIEEKKRLEQAEKEARKLEDLRDQRYLDLYAARQKAELEAEKRRGEEKTKELQKSQMSVAERARQAQIENDLREKNANRRGVPELNDGLEWWERQANEKRAKSRGQSSMSNTVPSRAAPRTNIPPPAGTFDSFDTMQGPTDTQRKSSSSRRQSIESRHSYRPSSSSRRNEGVMRQMSAMRERLSKEQARVKHAIKTDQYGHDVFSDDSDIDDDVLEARIKPKSRRAKSVSRYDDDEPSLMHRKSKKRSDDDDDDNDSLSSKNDPFKRSSKSSKSKRRSTAIDSDDDL